MARPTSEIVEHKEFEIVETDALPYLYIALLEYCSELTGDTIKDIDTQMARTIRGDNFPTGDNLNG